MNSYTQLTYEQRYQIKALMKMGHNQTEMAKAVGVHKSTVSRELRRNRGLKGYRPKQAHELALSRRCKVKPLIDASTWAVVEALIRLDLSPEQASGWLKDNYGLQISHEWIYQYILTDKHAGRRSPSPPTMPVEDPDQGKSAGSAMGAMTGVVSSKTG